VSRADTRVHPKYSALFPPSIQQLWYHEAPVYGTTTMSSESVRQVARSWVDVGSLHTRLFGAVYFDIASVRKFLDTPSCMRTDGLYESAYKEANQRLAKASIQIIKPCICYCSLLQ
jgi:hypothetical protein